MFTFTFLRNVLLLVYNLAAILLHNWSYCTKILYIEKYTDPIYFRPFYPFNYGIFGIKIDRVSMSVRIQDRAKKFASVEGMCGGGGARCGPCILHIVLVLKFISHVNFFP